MKTGYPTLARAGHGSATMRYAATAVFAGALALGALACSVDDRTLVPAGSGAPGPSMDPGGGGDGNTTPPGPTTLVDGCADLDTDGVADCTVTLVRNPSFTSDVDGWTAMPDATWTWDARNALDDAPSGSGKLTLETPRGSAVQCVPLSSSNEIIVAWANVFVEAPDEDGADNEADVGASFFASSDCSGTSVGSFEAPPSDVKGAWSVVNAGGVPLTPIGSVSVALNAIKDAPATLVTAYFDNVMLRTKPLD